MFRVPEPAGSPLSLRRQLPDDWRQAVMRALGHRSRRLSRSESVQFSFAQIRRAARIATGTSSSNPPGRTTAAIQNKAVRSELMGGILPSSRQEFCEIDHGRQDSVTGSPTLQNQDRWRNGRSASRGDDCNEASRPPYRVGLRAATEPVAAAPAQSPFRASRTINRTVQQFTRPDAAARILAVLRRQAANVMGTC